MLRSRDRIALRDLPEFPHITTIIFRFITTRGSARQRFENPFPMVNTALGTHILDLFASTMLQMKGVMQRKSQTVLDKELPDGHEDFWSITGDYIYRLHVSLCIN